MAWVPRSTDGGRALPEPPSDRMVRAPMTVLVEGWICTTCGLVLADLREASTHQMTQRHVVTRRTAPASGGR